MNGELVTLLEKVSETYGRLVRFNPNHVGSGPHGGEFASGGGGRGKHFAKRQRRKKLDKMRKEGHKDIADQRKRHRGERQEVLKTERQDIKQLNKEHASHRKSVLKEQKREREKLGSEHKRQQASFISERKEGGNKAVSASEAKEHFGEMKAEHAGERTALKSAQKHHRSDVVKEHGKQIEETKQEHREFRQVLLKDQSRERKQLIGELKQELREAFPKRKVKRAIPQANRRSEKAILRATGIGAEGIRDYILRKRGWTKRWKDGLCTGRQLLSLLEDCREYGRARLRHEAELLFEEYGEIVERSITSRARGAVSRFFQRTRQFLHELITAGVLLIKGSEPLTEDDIRIADRMTKRQHEFLEGFEREVQANPPQEISDLSSQVLDIIPPSMTAGQFIARAESYGNAVWQAGQQVNRGRIANDPTFVLERRYLGDPVTGHCLDCPPLAGRWVPVGTLPEIGDTECGGWCHCWFEYQTADGRVVLTPENEARKPYAKPLDTRPKGVGQPEAKTAEPPEVKPEPLPVKEVPKPKPAKSDNYPPARPLPSVEELIEGTGRTPDYYEEA